MSTEQATESASVLQEPIHNDPRSSSQTENSQTPSQVTSPSDTLESQSRISIQVMEPGKFQHRSGPDGSNEPNDNDGVTMTAESASDTEPRAQMVPGTHTSTPSLVHDMARQFLPEHDQEDTPEQPHHSQLQTPNPSSLNSSRGSSNASSTAELIHRAD